VEIDYARSVLTVHEPDRFRYRGTGTALPITFVGQHPYVKGRITLPGEKPIEGRFVIDTGSTQALVLNPTFVEANRALEKVPRSIRVRLGGVGGPSISPMGRIERLELGAYSMSGPTAVLRQPGPGHTSAEGSAGNIGGDILRRFKVILDYPRKRMILERGPSFEEVFQADMSGLQFWVRDDSTRAVEVVIVQDRSPGSDLGVAVGDVLETFDGRPVTPSELVDLRRRLREEGRTFRLGMRRGQARSELTLTTRRLI
jgi:hypothetical protein